MKIVSLSSKDTFGGAAKIAYRLHQSLLKQGIDDLMLVNSKRSKSNDRIIAVSSLRQRQSFIKTTIDKIIARKRELDRIKKWDRYLSTRLDKVYTDLEISLLGDSLQKLDFDILQLHWVGESFVNFTEFSNVDQPVVWTLHDCAAFTGICTYYENCDKYETHCGNCPFLRSEQEKDFSFEIFEQKLARYKNINFHIVCPSHWLAESVRKSRLLGNYPIHVIPNGIDANFFYPISKDYAKESLGLNSNKKYILFGGIAIDRDTRKGGHLLLESLDKLKTIIEDPDSIELLIFGTDSLNVDLPFSAKFLGYIDNEMFMRIVYSAADVTVVPSMYENLPTVILESLSCATPVVAFNVGGISDMVDHKMNGYLAQPYDTLDLALGLKYCINNDDSKSLQIKSRDKITETFTIEKMTKSYIDLYSTLHKKTDRD